MVYILQSNTIGNKGSLRFVIPNRPAAHKRAYVYCSTKGKRGQGNESFIIFLDTLEIKNYDATKQTINKGIEYVTKHIENCKTEWNRIHPNYSI